MRDDIVYPAIFKRDEEGGYTVEFYDLPGFTCGDDLNEAFNMAGDCLLAMVDGEVDLPKPTPLEQIKAAEGEYVLLVKPCYYDITAHRSDLKDQS